MDAIVSVYYDNNIVHKGLMWYLPREICRFERNNSLFILRFTGFTTSWKRFSLSVDGREITDDGSIVQSQPKTTVPSNFQILREENVTENAETIDTEEFPLDNRSGTDILSVEHEISKTISTEVSVGTSIEGSGGIAADLMSLLKTELSVRLSRQTGQTIGEVVTRRQTLRFSVAPHQFVTYLVIWKRKIRRGEYIVFANGRQVSVPYTVQYGLSYEIKSQ